MPTTAIFGRKAKRGKGAPSTSSSRWPRRNKTHVGAIHELPLQLEPETLYDPSDCPPQYHQALRPAEGGGRLLPRGGEGPNLWPSGPQRGGQDHPPQGTHHPPSSHLGRCLRGRTERADPGEGSAPPDRGGPPGEQPR